jgi:hypothetical protein
MTPINNMQQIKDLFNNTRILSVKSRRTERGDLITAFTERLNQERGDSYKPLTIQRVSYLLSVYKTGDLYYFLDKCNKAKNFSKCFWYFTVKK